MQTAFDSEGRAMKREHMRPEYLQDYLNWYVCPFRVKRDDKRWPNLERVVRHLVTTNATYRRSRK